MRHRTLTLLTLFALSPLWAQEGDPAPETRERKAERVLFLIDASSSMRIGTRWDEARALVAELQEKLLPQDTFDLVLFHTSNDELYEASKRATAARLERSRDWLKDAEPASTSATQIDQALKEAFKRRPDRIVLISDGVLNPGLTGEGYAELEEDVRRAARRTVIDTYAVQSGRYEPSPELEDLAGGAALLQLLAEWSSGRFAVASSSTAAPRLPAAPGAAPRVSLLDFRRDRDLPPEVDLGQKFRVVVDDATFAQLGWVDVPEYGTPVSLTISVVDPTSGIEIDRTPTIGLRQDGARLYARAAIELWDASRQLPKGARRALPLRARPGDLVLATYVRGEEVARAQVWIERRSEVVVVGGSVARCTCCQGGATVPLAPPVAPRPSGGGTTARPAQPLPPGVGQKPGYTDGTVPGQKLPPGVGEDNYYLPGGKPRDNHYTDGTIPGQKLPPGVGEKPYYTDPSNQPIPGRDATSSGRPVLPTGNRGTPTGRPVLPTGNQGPSTGRPGLPTGNTGPSSGRPQTGSAPAPQRPVTGSPPLPVTPRPVTGSASCPCGCHGR
ncbi:MAG: VWA domain-containing protein [Planctomycetota bacterium]